MVSEGQALVKLFLLPQFSQKLCCMPRPRPLQVSCSATEPCFGVVAPKLKYQSDSLAASRVVRLRTVIKASFLGILLQFSPLRCISRCISISSHMALQFLRSTCFVQDYTLFCPICTFFITVAQFSYLRTSKPNNKFDI